jgi:hypothetical protein
MTRDQLREARLKAIRARPVPLKRHVLHCLGDCVPQVTEALFATYAISAFFIVMVVRDCAPTSTPAVCTVLSVGMLFVCASAWMEGWRRQDNFAGE